MKAQTFLEYFLSLLVFTIFAVYIFFQISVIIPSHEREIKSQILRSEVYQMSELLITDAGQPSNWETLSCTDTDCSQVLRIGLMDESQGKTNLLSQNKIAKLNSLCRTQTGYDTIREKLDTAKFISIFILDTSKNSVLLSCAPQLGPATITNATITRTVAVGPDIAELTMWGW